MAWNHTAGSKLGQQMKLNLTQSNGTSHILAAATTATHEPLGIVGALLAGWLHSEQLKTLGPLVMGMGIFLFICANAVLHEDRDRHTKVIDLRDIYSTVIDVHNLRSKDQSCSSPPTLPPNGLVNYVQAHSNIDNASGVGTSPPEAGPGVGFGPDRMARSHGSWPSTLWGFGSGGGGGRRLSCARRCSRWHDGNGWGDTVYSVHKERERAGSTPAGRQSWDAAPVVMSTGSIVTSSLTAFTLPIIKLNNQEMEEGSAGVGEEEERGQAQRRVERKGEEEDEEEDEGWEPGGKDRPLFPILIETKADVSHAESSGSQSSLGTKRWGHRGSSPRWTLTEGAPLPMLLPGTAVSKEQRAGGSHLSLNALSDAVATASMGAAGGRYDNRARRFSCPRLYRTGSRGYMKLADLGGDSFEGPDGAEPSECTAGANTEVVAIEMATMCGGTSSSTSGLDEVAVLLGREQQSPTMTTDLTNVELTHAKTTHIPFGDHKAAGAMLHINRLSSSGEDH